MRSVLRVQKVAQAVTVVPMDLQMATDLHVTVVDLHAMVSDRRERAKVVRRAMVAGPHVMAAGQWAGLQGLPRQNALLKMPCDLMLIKTESSTKQS